MEPGGLMPHLQKPWAEAAQLLVLTYISLRSILIFSAVYTRTQAFLKQHNTTSLLFSLKGLEILRQERRGHVNTIMMEQFNSIRIHKSKPANKQHTYQFINQSINQSINQ